RDIEDEHGVLEVLGRRIITDTERDRLRGRYGREAGRGPERAVRLEKGRGDVHPGEEMLAVPRRCSPERPRDRPTPACLERRVYRAGVRDRPPVPGPLNDEVEVVTATRRIIWSWRRSRS